MGIKLIAREWKAGSVECCHKYICDTEADFNNLPDAPMGSTAVSLWSKAERVVNTKGRWIPYGEHFVGAPIIDLAEVEGEGGSGSLEFGKEVKFKETITEEDFQAYADNATPFQANDTQAMYIVATFASGITLILNRIIEADKTIWMFGDLTNAVYMYCVNATVALNCPDHCWVNSADKTPIEPPTEIMVEPNPEEIPMLSADLETTAIFFEVGGGAKTVLSVTDTNDEGIVKAYEVYADEVIVDTVPKAETIDATALGVTAGASVTVKAKSIIDTTSEASNAVIFA